MELTNHSFLETRRDYLYASNARKLASDRLSSGDRLSASKHDLGAIGVSAKLNTHRIQSFAEKTNLQNFHTYLDSQLDGLNQAKRIYDRMSVLATKALDPALAEDGTDLKSLNQEFQELSVELDKIVNVKVNGQRLYGGRSADFTKGLLDTSVTGATPQSKTIDVGTTKGTMTIELSPGGAQDRIWMFQGELPPEFAEYFEASTYDNSAVNLSDDIDRLNDLNDKLELLFEKQGIFTTGPWRTIGFAQDENYDKFEIKYDSCSIPTVKTTFHPLNKNEAGRGEKLYKYLTKNDLLKKRMPSPENIPENDRTKITMVGVNYNNTQVYSVKAKFEPELPLNDLKIPGSNDIFPAISFGSIECSNISNKENAKSVLSSISEELENLTDSFAAVAAVQSRTTKQTEHLNSSEVTYEAATSRVNDTDFAKEATDLASNSLKEELAAQMMSKSARLKDVLIPLTTNHFRSHFLKSTL